MNDGSDIKTTTPELTRTIEEINEVMRSTEGILQSIQNRIGKIRPVPPMASKESEAMKTPENEMDALKQILHNLRKCDVFVSNLDSHLATLV